MLPEHRDLRLIDMNVAPLCSLRTILSKRYGRQYLRFLLWCARRHPSRFAEAVRLGIQGFHFEAITREALAFDAIRHDSTRVADRLRERIAQVAGGARRVRRLPEEYRLPGALELQALRRRLDDLIPAPAAISALV